MSRAYPRQVLESAFSAPYTHLQSGFGQWRIPKGFRLKAQGCEERATLGNIRARTSTPKELCRFNERHYATITIRSLHSSRFLDQRAPAFFALIAPSQNISTGALTGPRKGAAA